MRLSTQITTHTLIGGRDNPNCFSLAKFGEGGEWDWGVRIVNMKMGAFERVCSRWKDVEAEMLSEHLAVLTDRRIPQNELMERWCSVCCPIGLMPPDQQREYVRRWKPIIKGELKAWQGTHPTEDVGEEEIDNRLAQLREIGEIA